jgi:Acyl-CoA dehydrogenase, C-terminal domain/Acetyl-CoA dehydrogenase C-terminal like
MWTMFSESSCSPPEIHIFVPNSRKVPSSWRSARTLTPIVKSWPSQWCLEANSLAIQIHGGYGYAREYDVEQHYRDNRLNPIHEGTHGIQALDLLGRKVTMQAGAGLRLLIETIEETIARAREAGESEYADALQAVVARLGEVTGTPWSSGDPELALANATVYLEAAGHTS